MIVVVIVFVAIIIIIILFVTKPTDNYFLFLSEVGTTSPYSLAPKVA